MYVINGRPLDGCSVCLLEVSVLVQILHRSWEFPCKYDNFIIYFIELICGERYRQNSPSFSRKNIMKVVYLVKF